MSQQDKPWPKRTTPVKDMPLTRVTNLDEPTSPARLIRLPPDLAVVWCHGMDMGDPDNPARWFPYLNRTDNGWVCGRYWAQATDLIKHKKGGF